MELIITTEEKLREIVSQCLREANFQQSAPPPPATTDVEAPISQPEALRFLGKSRQTFSKWRKEGKIKGHVLGGRVFFFKSELISALRDK